MVHELVFRISRPLESDLKSLKEGIRSITNDGNIQIVSYSSDGLLEESDNCRVCKTKDYLNNQLSIPKFIGDVSIEENIEYIRSLNNQIKELEETKKNVIQISLDQLLKL